MHHTLRPTTLRTLTACLLALAVACGGSSDPSPSGPTVTVTGLGWFDENIDPSYWSSPPPGGQAAFYEFVVHYDGDIAFSDILHARVYAPGGQFWTLSKNPRNFDAAARTIGRGALWYGSSVNVLPLGPLQVEVALVNGVASRYSRSIPAPGSLTTAPFATMHTEDVAAPASTSAPMVKRASIGATNTITAATQTISLSFSVNDAKVHDGCVWFYDSAGAYVGGYFYFRDPATGLFNPPLAGGLSKDGSMNTLTLQAKDLTLQAGASFAQIARFHVVLTDGAQYGAQGSAAGRYDCQSISARGALTAQ